MPGSRVDGKKEIKEWVEKQTDIRTIVDVGAGKAIYPKLLGALYNWIAIEIWAPYIKMWGLKDYYNKIIIGDIRYLKLPQGDLIIFGDVIEHLPKEDALKVIRAARRVYKHMIISLPLSEPGKIYPGEIHYDNWFEKHISGWTYIEINKLTEWDMALIVKGMGVFAK